MTTVAPTTWAPGCSPAKTMSIWTPGSSNWVDAQSWQNANRRTIVNPTGSGDCVRFKFKAHASSTTVISGASVGLRSGATDDFNGAPTRITFDGGNPTTTITAGTSKWSDWMYYPMTSGTDYLVHYYGNSGSFVRWKRVTVAGPNTYGIDAGPDGTMTQVVAYNSLSNAETEALEEVEAEDLSTTAAPTTPAPTTVAPTTVPASTVAPTTVAPTTVLGTTLAPTTPAPTTVAPSTVPPTTLAVTTAVPTTPAPAVSTIDLDSLVVVNVELHSIIDGD